jgi:hypothetical protein
MLLFLCLRVFQGQSQRFPVHLKSILEYEEADLLTESDVKAWLDASAETNHSLLPAGAVSSITVEDVEKVKSSAGMQAFAKWLATDAEEEDDDDDEED